MRAAVTEQTLRKQAGSATTLNALMAAKSKAVGETRPSTESSLLSSSVILSDGEKYTLVPAGSILHLPATHRSHVVEKPQGDFTFWPNFLQRNATWLAAKEIPLTMAKGDAKAAQQVLHEVATERRVLVAVYKNGPITILEPKPGAADADKPASKPAAADSKPTTKR